jgi:hypothetical protein
MLKKKCFDVQKKIRIFCNLDICCSALGIRNNILFYYLNTLFICIVEVVSVNVDNHTNQICGDAPFPFK